MKKTAILFASVALLAALPASARGVELPEWNHANDSNRPLTSVQEVHHAGVKPTAKKDDRIQFAPAYAAEGNGYEYGYQYLGRRESR